MLIEKIVSTSKMFNDYKISSNEDDEFELDHLSKINIFVGPNNSGKSLLLRRLYSLENFSFVPSGNFLDKYSAFMLDMKGEIMKLFDKYKIIDVNDLLKEVSEIMEIRNLKTEKSRFSILNALIVKLSHPGSPSSHERIAGVSLYEFERTKESYLKDSKELSRKLGSEFRSMVADLPNHFAFIYIPILRGLRPLDKQKDLYSERTKQDYFKYENYTGFEDIDNITPKIFTGYTMYESIHKLRSSSYEMRHKLDLYEEFLSDQFFENKKISLTADLESDVLLIKIGNEKERHVHSLGDGLQTLIIMTFQLFFTNKKTLVFIEEPEISLHPGLQRQLIEILYSNKYFDHCQFFITTHSNHFLDLTLDLKHLAVYSIKKIIQNKGNLEDESRFFIENLSNEHNSVLEMLGVRNSSVFLTNCSIWVEGITDRFYLRHYLKIYMKSLPENKRLDYKEDIHYSFVEYSGGNIIHWSFLDEDDEVDELYKKINVERLCSKLFLVTDKDNDKKLPRQDKLRANLGNRYFCLESKEIENLVKKEVLIKLLSTYEGKKINEDSFKIEFSEKDYKDEYLGSFIDSMLLDKVRKYAAVSGTINDKLKFCKRVIENTHSFDDLSTEAKRLVKAVYKFIASRNE